MQLHTADGARKYLTAGERDAFLRTAERADRDTRTLCMTLAHAGCRLSEALGLTADRVDLAAGVLVFESLKKRKRRIYRAGLVLLPGSTPSTWCMHGIRERQARRGKSHSERLWPWSRMTGWRAVHAVMAAAELDGPPASPKGLRHGLGVAAGIPLNLVQNCSATPSSPPPPSTPMPSAPRNKTSHAGCGVKASAGVWVFIRLHRAYVGLHPLEPHRLAQHR